MVQSFVSVTGKIKTQYFTYSYGVRPVIKVKANSVLLSDQPFDRDKVKNVTNKSNSITLNVTGTYKDGQTKKVLNSSNRSSSFFRYSFVSSIWERERAVQTALISARPPTWEAA